LIVEFSRLTGVGALLNTSFNLHGAPIVNTPQDAFDVLENSSLDGIALPGILILRNDIARVPPARGKEKTLSVVAS
jgi:carbamoyltransferase